ncbi:rhomboid family intramembrane serine protease [Dysgonomonas sp. 216]|uniref:rhomboid family intramembrane serine protease n=1 Tax=Dysgonomonas sp. 216 TaxID=2302934 RepID=UPI001624A2CE
MPTVTKNILIINILCWLAQYILASKGINIAEYTGLHFILSDKFMPHQIITYMFMHDWNGIGHLFFNMFAVFMFGRTLEMAWGPKRFLFYYLFTGIGAGIVQEVVWTVELWDYLSDPNIAIITRPFLTVGASGAVFGILLGFGMLFPNAQLFIIPFPFPIKAKYFVIGYGVIELFLGIASRSGDSVAHFAHLGGLLFGLILILYWRKTTNTSDRIF